MSKRMVTYQVGDDDKIASIDGHALGSGDGSKSISRRMITYKVDDAGKITSIDGHELAGGGGDYQIKELVVTENGLYDVAGEAYKPVRVNVPQTAQGGSVKALLDATKSAYYLFNEYKGTSVDELITFSDTSNVTSTVKMFNNCENLTSIPLLDTSNVSSMNGMFSHCGSLISIPELDTSNVRDMAGMFSYCRNLTTIPRLDVHNVSNLSNMFEYCNKLTSIGLYGFIYSIDITPTALEHDALVAFLNQAGTTNIGNVKITMGSAKLALLSDEEKAIATNKGWQLA